MSTITKSLTPSPTEQIVTAIMDAEFIHYSTQSLVNAVRVCAPSEDVQGLLDGELLTQAILGAVTRFVETAIDGQL